jgi:hypothetical protein
LTRHLSGFNLQAVRAALGVPNETIVIEPVGKTGDTKYYRDA